MPTTMLALVGGQPLPNLLPVRFLQPDGVLLIYTAGTTAVYERLAGVLRQSTLVYGCEADAYDIGAIEAGLRKRLAEPDLATTNLIFNLTGGTKAMVLAAYQIAEERQASIIYLESEGKQSRLYQYDWQSGKPVLRSCPILPTLVQLSDILDLYLGLGKWHITGPSGQPGGPFESSIEMALKQAQFDEVLVGVHTMNNQIDIDLVVRVQNQIGIIEAKTGNAGQSLAGIKQLSNAVRHLGTYTQQFYVITVPLNPHHEDVIKAARITPISVAGYILGQQSLPAGEAERVAQTIRKGLIG